MMAVKRDVIIDFINKTLKVEPDQDPYLYNGVQVIGRPEVRKIVLGVSANLEIFKKAATWGAQMIILHHGLLGPKGSPITQVLKNRLKVLFGADITLLTYHLFLDRHPTLGNNAQIIKLIGAKKGKEFGLMEKLTWGYEGEFSTPISIKELMVRVKKICGSGIKVYQYGPKMVKKIGVVSGGGPYLLSEAVDKKLDAYLTGEITESRPALAKEAGIHFFHLGHYNSEKFGVLALGEVLKKKFPQLEIKFIDIFNPL